MEFDEQQAGATPEFKPCFKFDKRGEDRKRLFLKVAERKKKKNFHRRQTHGVTVTHTNTCTEMQKIKKKKALAQPSD